MTNYPTFLSVSFKSTKINPPKASLKKYGHKYCCLFNFYISLCQPLVYPYIEYIVLGSAGISY